MAEHTVIIGKDERGNTYREVFTQPCPKSWGGRESNGRVATGSPLSHVRVLISAKLKWRRLPSHRNAGSCKPQGHGRLSYGPPRRDHEPPERKRSIRRKLCLQGIVLFALAAAGTVWCSRSEDRFSGTVIVPKGAQQQLTGGEHSPNGYMTAARPIYPLSVIPGGAYSVEELKAYLKADPVARRSFEAQAKRMGDPELLSHLVVRQAPKRTKMYSQLRKGSKLCWTAEPVTVEPGEPSFYHKETGEMVARARCGNVMVAALPAGAVRLPPPPPTPIGWTAPIPPPPSRPPAISVAGERGAQPPPPLVQQEAPPVVVQPAVPQMPTITITSAPPVMPPAPAAAPPIVVPPYVLAAQPASLPPISVSDRAIPWWGLVGGGLLAGAAGRYAIHTKDSQKERESEPDKGPEHVPEPGTLLLMTLGLGGAGLLFARRRGH